MIAALTGWLSRRAVFPAVRWFSVGRKLLLVDDMNMPLQQCVVSDVVLEGDRAVLVCMSGTSERDANGRIRFSAGKRRIDFQSVHMDHHRKQWTARL